MDETKRLLKAMRLLGKEMGLWKHGYGYKYYFSTMFKDFNLNGKNVLEIGCGDGKLCIGASIHGANHVVGLEPLAEGSGSSKKAYIIFNKMVKSLNLKNIEILPFKIQDYKCTDNYVDIILSVASINHWDENACIDLQDNEEARKTYLLIFKKLHKMMKKGGKLILIECSNRNLFGDIGIKNPFSPRIEWFKHQAPEYWVYLLSSCGFGEQKISWLLPSKLRYLGRLERLLGNRLTSYCMGSAFRVEMTCFK